MTLQLWSGIESRQIIRRVVVEGRLVLQSPAHFGNGDTDDLIDMPLLRDPYDNEYKYKSPGEFNETSFDIWSIGQDGKDGTDDDVKNWRDT